MKFVPRLAIVSVCGSGLAPPNGLVKSMPFTWLNALSSTMTMTGMVTLMPVVCSTTCPMNVPASSPPPGRLATATPTDSTEGAVPLEADSVSQLPPSAVLPAAVQLSEPVPPFRISRSWLVIVVPWVFMEYVNCPGRLSKNVLLTALTVSVRARVID